MPDELRQRAEALALKQRAVEAAVKQGQVDLTSGAPGYVRALVGAASTPRDRLATIRKFFPDAMVDPIDPDNFLYTNPETKRLTRYNPKGIDLGDLASVGREVAQGVGSTVGAVAGTAAGAPAGPAGAVTGAVVGAGMGAEAGEQVFQFGARTLGAVNTQSTKERMIESGERILSAGAGQQAGMLIGPLMQTAIRSAGPKAASEMSRRLAAFERTGAPGSVGLVTDKHWVDAIENLLSKTPGGAGVIANRAKEMANEVGDFIQRQSARLAKTEVLSAEKAGRTVEKGIKGDTGFIGRFQAKGDELRTAIDNAIPAATPVQLNNTLAALDKVAGTIGGAEKTSEAITQPALRALKEALETDMAALSNSQALPYGVISELRKRIGAKLSDTSLIVDIPRGELKKIYAAMSDDIRETATAIGPDALKAFERHNTFYSAGIKRIEETLEPLMKDRAEDVFKALDPLKTGREGATLIRGLKRSLEPEEWNIVVGTVMRRLGRAKPGQQDELGEKFSFETFLTNWNGLSGEAKDTLFNGTTMSGLRADMDAVATVASSIRESSKAFQNPSGTAGALVGSGMMMVGGGGAATAAITGDTSFGVLAGMLGLSVVGANVSARLLTNPKFVHWLADGIKMEPNGFGAHLGRLTAIAKGSDSETQAAIRDYLDAFSRTDTAKQPTQ